MLHTPLMVVLLAPIAGQLAAVYGHRRLLVPGGLIYASGALVLLFGLTTTPQFLTICAPNALPTGIRPRRSSRCWAVLQYKICRRRIWRLAVSESGASPARHSAGASLTFAILGDTPSAVQQFHGIYLLMIASGLSVSILSLEIDTLPKRAAALRGVAQPQIGLE